jgi:hypothetical protein
VTDARELGTQLMDTLDTIHELVTRVDAEAGPGSDVHRVADQAVARLQRSQLNVMASLWLAEEVKSVRRARTQQAERLAEEAQTRRDRRERRQAAAERREEESYERMEAIARIIQDHSRALRMEWTEELLASGFALPDGEVVTWGDATIGQHQQRASMFEANAQANAQGAARHLHAIQVLTTAGASCLREVVSGE